MTATTLWLFNIAIENGPFIDDFPIKTTIYSGFSMAMLNNQMIDCMRNMDKLWYSCMMLHVSGKKEGVNDMRTMPFVSTFTDSISHISPPVR